MCRKKIGKIGNRLDVIGYFLSNPCAKFPTIAKPVTTALSNHSLFQQLFPEDMHEHAYLPKTRNDRDEFGPIQPGKLLVGWIWKRGASMRRSPDQSYSWVLGSLTSR
jgi:hypothetical protein